MNARSLQHALEHCSYPGRMLLLGTARDGSPYWAYAVTGRSDASKARRAVLVDDGLVIESTEADAAVDPLRHYQAIRRVDDALVLGNGDHVDRFTDVVRAGSALRAAFAELEPEPDPPIMTPRIVAVGHGTNNGWSEVAIGGVRQADNMLTTEREAARYDRITPGTAVMAKTYSSDGIMVKSDAIPRLVTFTADRDAVAEMLWQLLAPRFRVLVASGDPQMRNVTIIPAS